jgi:hypothetical protein
MDAGLGMTISSQKILVKIIRTDMRETAAGWADRLRQSSGKAKPKPSWWTRQRAAKHWPTGWGTFFIASSAAGSSAMAVGDMSGGAEISVERLQLGERERIVERRQPGLRMGPSDIGQNGRRFGQHAAVGHERRRAAFRIDLEIAGLGLLGCVERWATKRAG